MMGIPEGCKCRTRNSHSRKVFPRDLLSRPVKINNFLLKRNENAIYENISLRKSSPIKRLFQSKKSFKENRLFKLNLIFRTKTNKEKFQNWVLCRTKQTFMISSRCSSHLKKTVELYDKGKDVESEATSWAKRLARFRLKTSVSFLRTSRTTPA